jgi:NAD(P)-dependent dehydrogenase (short-subunit alcohol dehydrogenase family)
VADRDARDRRRRTATNRVSRHPGGAQELAGKVAVVTGGGSGLGAGMVEAFASMGMSTVVADIELRAAESVAARTAAMFGVETSATEVDVADAEAVEQLAAFAWDRHGSVHLVCNNAGVMPVGGLLEMSVAEWRWLYEVNVLGVVHGIAAFVPRLLAQAQPARVVNTASMAAFAPSDTVGAYASSKQAVLGITEALRMELADTHVRVSVVCPGAVASRITESERNRPERHGPASGRVIPESVDTEKAAAQRIDATEAGRRVLEAILADEFWIFTHPSWARRITSRFDEAAAAATRTIERTSR